MKVFIFSFFLCIYSFGSLFPDDSIENHSIAISVTDELYRQMDLQLDPEELKETDKERTLRLALKTVSLFLANPNRLENRDNIEEHILSHQIKKELLSYLSSDKDSVEKDVEQVFDLLQTQVTTASTKTVKRTNEAPNIVSVFQQKEIQDYGRFSI
ncbi:MAG: hypothetical protein H7A25_10200 [Leptospiraceae bacterium]|nr:hypothetical protein [Leptospiraceae bacterium]MCP5500263.1 hypothetical protein [Leptospiraceae bacterium]